MFLIAFFDYFAVLAAELITLLLRNGLFSFLSDMVLSHEVLYSVPVIYVCCLYLCDLYVSNMQFWNVIRQLFKASAFALIGVITLQYAGHDANSISRLFIFLLLPISFFMLVLERYVIKKFIKSIYLFQTKVVLVGDGPMAKSVVSHFMEDMAMSYKFLGFVADDYEVSDKEEKSAPPLLGGLNDLEAVIKETQPDAAMIFAQNISPSSLTKIIFRVQPLVKIISIIPYFPGVPLANVTPESLVDDRAVVFRIHNNLSNRIHRIFKFTAEWLLTLFGTILISPLLLLISVWIYIDSPGPVIFKHRRVGMDGKEFDCIKFRSMCVNAQDVLDEILANDPAARAEWDKDFKLKDDPRITKSGAFLRRTSLDELPQIFNVLKGEMSLVGPRPIVKKEIERYHEYIADYYLVRPGITGLWQTSGRNDVDYKERVRLDSWYVRNWSFWMDVVILFRTFKVAAKGMGAY